MKQRTHYRAVFISDTHLGFRGAKVKQLLAFLKSIECDELYLVGDIIDLWVMQKQIMWDDDCSAVLRRILKMVKHGTIVRYCPGNHDEAVRKFLPLTFGTADVQDEFIHTTSSGDRYLILHGDQFDFVVGHMKWLARLGSMIYDRLVQLNTVVHHLRMMVGFKTYWSLSSYLKMKTKKAVSFVRDFETAALLYAKGKKCVGVVCGHIHTAKIDSIDGSIYANCGDWVESLTALVETAVGQLELIHWHDMTAVGVCDVPDFETSQLQLDFS